MTLTRIKWADAVWNPVTGCSPVSEGCANCYAQSMAQRLKGRYGYPADDPFRPGTVHEDRMEEPLRWRKPRRVFVCSMGDPFHEAVSEEVLEDVIHTIAECLQHTFMILTKRPHIMRERFRRVLGRALSPNLWLGVSVENQAAADERIPELLKTPAAVRFVSCEPLLGPVDLWPFFSVTDRHGEPSGPRCDPDGTPAIKWVICGGETGPHPSRQRPLLRHGTRPMHPDWVRGLRDQCQEAGVPFFFKSWGEWMPADHFIDLPSTREWLEGDGAGCCITEAPGFTHIWRINDLDFFNVGRKIAGRRLDGREWNEWPEIV